MTLRQLVRTAGSFLMMAAIFATAVVPCVQPLLADSVPNSHQIAVSLTEKDGRIVSDPAPPAYDFGQRASMDDPTIVQIFRLQNKTGHALTIALLRPSCGCITASIKPNPPNDQPVVLKPDASVSIQVTLSPEVATPGPIEKTISVFAQGQASPVSVLHMKGVMTP